MYQSNESFSIKNINSNPYISVSYHPDKIMKVKTFRTREITSIDTLVNYVENFVWSPIVYKDEQRKKINFLQANYIALDVDAGMKLTDAIDLLKEFQATAIVGTTANHQKQKDDQPPCDRFRVVLEMTTTCVDCEQFEFNVRSWRKLFSGDRATTDGARLFKPCKVVYKHESTTQDWLPLPPTYKRIVDREAAHQVMIARHRHQRTLPTWILRAQSEGVPMGGGVVKGRHHACFRIGATMTELGYSVDDIVDFLCAGPLIMIGEKDVRRQVECGAAKAVGQTKTNETNGNI